MTIVSLARIMTAAAAALILAACTTNPATGRRFFSTLSPQQEAAIGAQAAPELTEEFGGKTPSPELQAYITEVGRKLAAQTEAYFPTLDWEFTLLDSPVVNAFALPGGKVFISRGLAEKLESEAELAGVLGHEVGHVSAQHTSQRMSQALGLNLALGVAGLAVGTSGQDSDLRRYGQYALPALAVGGNLYLLKFGRSEESEADYLGMRYMSKAGYNPRAQARVMEILKAEERRGRPPEFLSTHPLPESRIADIQKLLNSKEFADTANLPFYPERYQQRFLSVVRTLPPARQPAPAPEGQVQQRLQQQRQSRTAQPAQGMQPRDDHAPPPASPQPRGGDVIGRPPR
jgi:predicted Zn-dependent protease